MVASLHLLSSLVTIVALSETIAARPTVFVPNSKLANKIASANSSSTVFPVDSSPANFWVSTSSNLYVPGSSSASSSQNAAKAEPVSTPLSTVTIVRSTPSVALLPPTNLPSPVSVSITPTPIPIPAGESWSSRLLKRFFNINVAALQAELLSYRVENDITPTPFLPGQIARAQAYAAAQSKSSSKSAAAAKTKTTQRATTTSKASVKSTTTSRKTTTTKKVTPTSSKKISTTTSKAQSKTTTTQKVTTTSVKRPQATTASSAGGLTDGVSFWKEKSSFFSVDSFTTDVVDNKHYSWGGNNIAVYQGVPAKEWTSGKQGDKLSALQVAYPKGSRNPGNSPQGGVGFYTSKIDVTAATNVSLSYSIFFPKGFNFVKGGKLPGLYGGAKACSGGAAAQNCFSTRMMFRQKGMGELYLYAPREKQVEALCTLGPLSYCNSVYGMSIGRGSWTFKTGEWTDLKQDIWLNTPGKADGGFNIWVNGELVLHSDSVYYRNSAAGMNSNGTSTGDIIDLIDYESLPDDLIIPNGGFKTNPLANTTTQSTSQGSKRSVIKLGGSDEKIFGQNGRKFVSKVPMHKRANAAIAPGFLGAMAQTFFGGSSDDYNSPTLQHTYFRRFELAIN
ncbi:uncharacterized protein JCM6883_002054 [Sporobolomyces salmoneus]|uniref:uncharacterized protein n=1 Tax=Sporobolomyces salmoneus TaxID=183962 RepID=UPI00316EDC0E